MWGWIFISLGILLGGVSAFLIYYGQDLRSKMNAAPAVNVVGGGNAVNVGGILIQILPPGPEQALAQSSGQNVARVANQGTALIENGSFERGLAAWGSGFFESQFPIEGPLRRALTTNGAVATWRVEGRRARTGSLALRVEHTSPYGANVYSTLSQRIKLRPQTTYRVGFWFFADPGDPRGSFNLRFLASRRSSGEEWDRRKIKVNDPRPGVWIPYSDTFNTEGDTYFDVRFFAERRVSAWIDDVFVEEVSNP